MSARGHWKFRLKLPFISYFTLLLIVLCRISVADHNTSHLATQFDFSPKDTNTSRDALLQLPTWMPSYLYQTLELRPSSQFRNIANITKYEIRTATLATLATLSSTLLRPLFLIFKLNNRGSTIAANELAASARINNMLGAGNLIQLAASNDSNDLIYRLISQSYVVPAINAAINPDTPASTSVLSLLPSTLLSLGRTAIATWQQLSPVAHGHCYIENDDYYLNQLLTIDLVMPDKIREPGKPTLPVIDIIPGILPPAGYKANNLMSTTLLSLIRTCRQLDVTQLRLYPIYDELGRIALYTRVWRAGQPGELIHITIPQKVDEKSQHWWTDAVFRRQPLQTFEANPLSPQILHAVKRQLPCMTAPTRFNGEPVLPSWQSPFNDQIIKARECPYLEACGLVSNTQSHSQYVTLSTGPDACLFINYHEHYKTSLPRIHLITDIIEEDLSEYDLKTIAHLQPPPPLQPLQQLLHETTHSLFWLYVAVKLHTFSEQAGAALYQML